MTCLGRGMLSKLNDIVPPLLDLAQDARSLDISRHISNRFSSPGRGRWRSGPGKGNQSIRGMPTKTRRARAITVR